MPKEIEKALAILTGSVIGAGVLEGIGIYLELKPWQLILGAIAGAALGGLLVIGYIYPRGEKARHK